MSKVGSRQGHVGGVSLVLVLVLSLVTCVFGNNKCATLYSANSYQGNPFSLTDGSKNAYLRHMNYVPQSIRVTPGCFLTIFDTYGNMQTLDRDYENIGWFPYRVLDATCCECGGCMGAANNLDAACARLYENPRCNACAGYRLDMQTGDEAKYFGPLDKKMTSVAVKQGCTLTVFSEANFGGWRFNFTTSNNMLGSNWHQQISSARCGCDNTYMDFGSNHPYPSMQPPVPTRRPLITLPTDVPSKQTFPFETTTTARPPVTLPYLTSTTARPLITLPYVTTTTTRPPITLPYVSSTTTTKPPITITYITTTTTRPPITLPVVTTTEKEQDEKDSFGFDDWYGDDSSQEILPETTTTTTQYPSTDDYKADPFSIEDGNINAEYDGDDDEEEEAEEEDSWEF